jgi:hypothetical protein
VARSWINVVSALLIITQVVVAPAARALASDTACVGCDHATPAGTSHATHDCDDHHGSAGGAHCSPLQDCGAGGQCNCVHVSAQGPAAVTCVTPPARSTTHESLSGAPKGPAFSSPCFDFLRPPK